MKPLTPKIITITTAALLLTACSDNTKIIRKGTMPDHPEATIEQIFESCFDNGKWAAIESDGKQYVTFNGTISNHLNEKAKQLNRNNFRSYVSNLMDQNNSDSPTYEVYAKPNSELYSEIVGNLKKDIKQWEFEWRNINGLAGEYSNKQMQENHKDILDRRDAIVTEIETVTREIEPNYEKKFSKSYFLEGMTEDAMQKLYSDKIHLVENFFKLKEENHQLYKTIRETEQMYFEKEYMKYAPSKNKYRNAIVNHSLDKAEKSYKGKRQILLNSLLADFEQKYYWVPGSEVTFKWLIYANKKDFEIVSILNDNWELSYGETGTDILNTIYAE